jgi:ketosteroid isomerase-like protein
MSDAPEELAVRVVEAFGRGDLDAGFAELDPDAELDLRNSVGPYAGVFRGEEALRERFGDFFDTWADLGWTTTGATPVGDGRVVLVLHITGGGRAGVAMEARAAVLVAIRDDRVARITLFQSGEDALAAAGAS